MFTITVKSVGMDALRQQVQQARDALPTLIQHAVQEAGNTVQQAFSDAAPKGKGEEGTPPGDDEPGHLADSFYTQEESPPSEYGAAISVRTHQPQKLVYVIGGTGLFGASGQRIVPTTKMALAWPGGDHPVHSVSGMQANDFVSPVIDAAPTSEEVLGPVIDKLAAILEAQ